MRSPDHPRSRGEYILARSALPRARGSSPLSRGILNVMSIVCDTSGIIPALAGNTQFDNIVFDYRSDHPRSRGEYTLIDSYQRKKSGSSPLSRGIRPVGYQPTKEEGIIPALAGNTEFASNVTWQHKDHPRSRGEYGVVRRRPSPDGGSSPLSRGILIMRPRLHVAPRIIPALAGNTAGVRPAWAQWGDHPRSRGEYLAYSSLDHGPDGSSPLSRGIQASGWHPHVHARIIPALAGNTPVVSSVRLLDGDHPRSRGEYDPALPIGRRRPGSSPLSRGIPWAELAVGVGIGIIPALAGNTRASHPDDPHRGDHPRSRGEYRLAIPDPLRDLGSSPLSRGIRGDWRGNSGHSRIIPALAGNTDRRLRRRCPDQDHPRSRGEYLYTAAATAP